MLIGRGGTEGLLSTTFLFLSFGQECTGNYKQRKKRRRQKRKRKEKENNEIKIRFLIELTEDQIRQNPPGECKRCVKWRQDRCMELEECQFPTTLPPPCGQPAIPSPHFQHSLQRRSTARQSEDGGEISVASARPIMLVN